MLKRYRVQLAFICCTVAPLAHAATLDLTQFTLTAPPPSGTLNSYTTKDFASLMTGATLSTNLVSNIKSFDWFFYSYQDPDGRATFTTSTMQPAETTLAASAGRTYVYSGWRTYNFATPYTGPLSFSIDGMPGTGGFSLKNLTQAAIPAVPEPETYAMLAAGLGLMGCIARRRARRAPRSGKRLPF